MIISFFCLVQLKDFQSFLLIPSPTYNVVSIVSVVTIPDITLVSWFTVVLIPLFFNNATSSPSFRVSFILVTNKLSLLVDPL